MLEEHRHLSPVSTPSGPRITVARNTGRQRSDQRGTALILALVMLAIMSLLGAMVLSTVNTELKITSNFRASQEAFFAAERGVEYASVAGGIYNSVGIGAPLDLSSSDLANIVVGGYGLDPGATNEVGYLTSGPLPPSAGSDATLFEMRYYRVTVTGQGPKNASVRVESQIGRLVPK